MMRITSVTRARFQGIQTLVRRSLRGRPMIHDEARPSHFFRGKDGSPEFSPNHRPLWLPIERGIQSLREVADCAEVREKLRMKDNPLRVVLGRMHHFRLVPGHRPLFRPQPFVSLVILPPQRLRHLPFQHLVSGQIPLSDNAGRDIERDSMRKRMTKVFKVVMVLIRRDMPCAANSLARGTSY